MAIVGTNCGIYLDGYDLSGDFNALSIVTELDAHDVTTWRDSEVVEAKIMEPGLPKSSVEFGGYWRSDTAGPDKILRDRFAVKDGVLLVVTGLATAEGASAYLLSASQGRYAATPEVEKVIEYHGSFFGTANRPGMGGSLLHPKASRASSGTSTPLNLGAIGSSGALHGVLQVFSGTGTLDATIQSDALVGFGSPADILAFTQATGLTAQYATLAGAVADPWWRVAYTITGGPFVFAVGMAIS